MAWRIENGWIVRDGAYDFIPGVLVLDIKLRDLDIDILRFTLEVGREREMDMKALRP